MKIAGLGASPGIARGPVVWLHRTLLTNEGLPENISLEVVRQRALQALDDLKTTTSSSLLQDVLKVHTMIIEDPLLWDSISSFVSAGVPKDEAVRRSVETIATQFAAFDDPYLAARAEDIRDVGQHILAQFQSASVTNIWPATEPSVLVSDTLFPSDTAKIDLTQVAAIVLSQGSVTSHVAILSRSLQIPAVIVGAIEEWLHEGDIVTVDGSHGEVTDHTLTPSQRTMKIKAFKVIPELVCTKDGCEVRVEANIGSIKDAKDATSFGSDGVGLLRTEFLFGGDHFPSEEEQYEVLRTIAIESPKGHPITVRAVDIGGDKPLSYMTLPPEPNPFLGTRAHRLLTLYPHLYDSQLRAVLRLGQEFPIRLMFPMIATIDDWTQCQSVLNRAITSLNMATCPVPVGMMVEVPAAIFSAPELSVHAQFFSIGTNDLIQYLFAADRSVSTLGTYYRPGDLAVVRALRHIIRVGCRADIPVGLCGEMAGDTSLTTLLLAVGLREFSVSPALVPHIKELIASCTLVECETQYRDIITERSWTND